MARTALVAQAITDAGLTPVYTPALSGGHTVSPGDILHVKNASGGATTVTITTGATLEGKAVADTVIGPIANSSERFIGDLNAALYQQTSGPDAGRVLVDFSSVNGVTVAALRP